MQEAKYPLKGTHLGKQVNFITRRLCIGSKHTGLVRLDLDVLSYALSQLYALLAFTSGKYNDFLQTRGIKLISGIN